MCDPDHIAYDIEGLGLGFVCCALCCVRVPGTLSLCAMWNVLWNACVVLNEYRDCFGWIGKIWGSTLEVGPWSIIRNVCEICLWEMYFSLGGDERWCPRTCPTSQKGAKKSRFFLKRGKGSWFLWVDEAQSPVSEQVSPMEPIKGIRATSGALKACQRAERGGVIVAGSAWKEQPLEDWD